MQSLKCIYCKDCKDFFIINALSLLIKHRDTDTYLIHLMFVKDNDYIHKYKKIKIKIF